MAVPASSFGPPRAGVAPVIAQPLPAFQPAPVPAQPEDDGMLAYLDKEMFSDLAAVEKCETEFAAKLNTISPGYFLMLVGAIVLGLLTMTPMWDATRLVNSDTFVFFMGRSWPFWTIGFCCGVIGFYIICMSVMLRGKSEKSMSSYMYLFTTMITILGLGLLLLAQPLRVNTLTAYNELMMNCNDAPQTKQLTAYYNVLLNMRLQPACAAKTSVEECAGYQETQPFTGYLKQMELGYLCSGFCYAGPAAKPTTVAAAFMQQVVTREDANETDYLGLLQFHSQDGEDFSFVQISRDAKVGGHSHAHMQGLFLLAANKNVSKAAATPAAATPAAATPAAAKPPAATPAAAKPAAAKPAAATPAAATPAAVTPPAAKPAVATPVAAKPVVATTAGARAGGTGDTANNMVATGWMNKYPPTLFTQANYKTTCEGAAARELRFSSGETANLMYLEGAALLVFSIFAGLMKLTELCKGRERITHEMVSGPDGATMKKVVL